MSALSYDELVKIAQSIPLPKDSDPDHVDIGPVAWAYLRSLSVPVPLPSPLTSWFGLPVYVKPELDGRTVRVISRAGDVLNEWQMPG